MFLGLFKNGYSLPFLQFDVDPFMFRKSKITENKIG